MALTNTMRFFDMNYLELADSTVTGTSLNTATAVFAYDNRSDAGNVTWAGTTGSIDFYFANSPVYLDSFFVNNHNWQEIQILVANTATAAPSQVAQALNQTTNAYFYQHGSTLTVARVRFSINGTQDGAPAYAGELISTLEKFQLQKNPSTYIPEMRSVDKAKQMYSGKYVFNETNNFFQARIGWSFLEGDPDTLTNTDLQNMTELVRKHTSFLFWPNANNSFVNMYTWRPQDVFKCRIFNDVSYEFSEYNLAHMIRADYDMVEVV